jgi:hypothetical protein
MPGPPDVRETIVKWEQDDLEYMRQRYEIEGATSTTVAKEITERTGRQTTGAAIRNARQ